MKILIAGGTGFLGRALVSRLAVSGHEITVLTRNPAAVVDRRAKTLLWNPQDPEILAHAVNGTEAVLNFAGESIGGKRWSARQKEIIVQSRIQPAQALYTATQMAERRPGVYLSASGVGIYGDIPDGEVSEAHPPGNDFLATTCVRWEERANAFSNLGMRVVIFRAGVVLGKGGGALARMAVPFRLFAGGILGTGRQWFPWVHMEDVASAVVFALREPDFSGPANLVGPEAVTMDTFCRTLGRVLRRPVLVKVPSFALRAVLGEMAEMLLTGQRAVPARLGAAGFRFTYPTISGALTEVFG
jgi:hypothetical protein